MNGVLTGELVGLSNDNKITNLTSTDDKLTIEQIYEPNNNNLNQICKQEQFKRQQLDRNNVKTIQNQTKDQLDDAKSIDEKTMNLMDNNLTTFNTMLQSTNYCKNDANSKQHYQTLYGHHRQMNKTTNHLLLNGTNPTNKNVQSNTQLSQYELKSNQTIQQYELSQEMLDKRVEVLMRKYGDRAWQSAMLIQRFWRNRQMSKRFHNLALGNQQLNNGTSQSIKENNELTSKSVNDLNLSGMKDDDKLNNTVSDQSQMDLMEISNTEIIITDKTHPLNNGNSTSQQKLINATLEALKTPLADGQTNNQMTNSQIITKNLITNNRPIMKRYSNASLQSTHSTSSSGSSSSSMPRSPTMPLQKNIFYNSNNNGSILSNCSTTTPINQHSTSHILLNSSPLHPNATILTNGQPTQLIYANGNNIYTNVCLTNNNSNSGLMNGTIINPYFKSNQTTPVLTPQHSLLNTPAYIHSINQLNNSQLNGSAMSLQSCLSNNNLSRQSLLSTLSNNPLMFAGSPQQQLHQQQLAKQQQLQISQYETLRKR